MSRRYKFIRDAPASFDQLSSHKRLALDLASAVRENPDIQTIGLLGPWGSGKSTVLGILTEFLEKKRFALKSADGRLLLGRVYVFDAWINQGEPPRKAFLRGMLEAPGLRDCLSDPKLHDEVDLVTGMVTVTETTDTPRFTAGARAIVGAFALWALLATDLLHLSGTPAANALMNWDRALLPTWAEGLEVPAIPLLTVLGVFLTRVAKRWNHGRATKSKRGNANATLHIPEEPLFSFLVNRQHQTRRTRITGASTPTAVDFQRVFGLLLRAIDKEGGRLVVIVDNLDRLPDAEAREVWTMLRAFAPHAARAPAPAHPGPCMIAAVAADAVDALYDGSTTAGTRSEGFLHKTFDITFQVPPPALAGWKGYLENELKSVFGDDLGADDAAHIFQLADGRWAADHFVITPRRINALINGMCARRGHKPRRGISLPVLAYYCLNQAAIEKDIHTALRAEVTGFAAETDDWRVGVAAIYYGVSCKDAAVVLVDEALDLMFAEGAITRYTASLSVIGADVHVLRYLSAISDRDSNEWRQVFVTAQLLTLGDFFNAAQFLAGIGHLRKMLDRNVIGFDSDGFDLSVLHQIVNRTPHRALRPLLGSMNRAFASLPEGQSAPTTAIALFWREMFEAKPEDQLPERICIPGDADEFITAASGVTDSPLLFRLKTHALPADIVSVLAHDLDVVDMAANTSEGGWNGEPVGAGMAYLRLKTIWATRSVTDWSAYERMAVQHVFSVAQNKHASWSSVTALRAPFLALSLLSKTSLDARMLMATIEKGGFIVQLADSIVTTDSMFVLGQFIGLTLANGIWPASSYSFDFQGSSRKAKRQVRAGIQETLELVLPPAQVDAPWKMLFQMPPGDDPIEVSAILDEVDVRREQERRRRESTAELHI